MHSKILISILLVLVQSIFHSSAFAWGERGHDLITRVAVQNLVRLSGANKAVTTPFTQRDHMLSHLSNVPDIVWRADYMSKSDRDLNYPTHYISLERVYDNARKLSDIDLDYSSFATAARQKGIDEPSRVGTAPWRVLQLHAMTVESLRQAGLAKSKSSKEKFVNQALSYAGLMSHFIGDLANPHHTSVNHDGQLTGNTGLHAYFENDVVSVLPLSLMAQVDEKLSAFSDTALLQKTVLSEFSQDESAEAISSPETLIFSLVLNGQKNLDRLTQLDNKYSLLAPSKSERELADREPPEKVAALYQGFIVERLAIGAAVLSRFWWLAWQEAGEPDLSDFFSYYYLVKPDFIPPNYLE